MPLPNIREMAPMRVNAVATSGSAGVDGNPYYREITVTEQSGTDLTDYQVRIDLDSTNFDFSHSTSDGSDVRITDDSDNKLSFWIEKWDSTNQEATIWVKVPSIPANSSVAIRIYYGNTSLTTESDGDNTFDFFDDFDGSDLDTDKWIQNTLRGSISVSDGALHITATGTSDDLHAGGAVVSKYSLSSNYHYTVEALMRRNYAYCTGEWGDRMGLSSDNTSFEGTYYGVKLNVSYADLHCNTDKDVVVKYLNASDDTNELCNDYIGNWIHIIAKMTPDYTVDGTFIYPDGTTYNIVSPAGSGDVLYPFLDYAERTPSAGTSETADYDWIIVRKYASTEPSTSVGNEQQPTGIPSSSRINNIAR